VPGLQLHIIERNITMTHLFLTLSEHDFEDQFPLIPNHLNPDANWLADGVNGFLFELSREEFDFIRSQPSRHVWTLVDGEDGNLAILSGIHFVNRLGYFLSKVPVPEGVSFEVNIQMLEPGDGL
jgi:hypothetical protein